MINLILLFSVLVVGQLVTLKKKGKIIIEGWGGRDPRMIPDAKMNAYQKPPKTLPRSVGHFIFLALLFFGHLYLHYLWHKR